MVVFLSQSLSNDAIHQQKHPTDQPWQICCPLDSSNILSEDEGYCRPLYQHSTFYRLVLSGPHQSAAEMDKWHRLRLEIVNELGLSLIGTDATNCALELRCELLCQNTNGGWQHDTQHILHVRPLQVDRWDSLDDETDKWPGFFGGGHGGLEYQIKNVSGKRHLTKTKYVLHCIPTNNTRQTVNALSLVVPIILSNGSGECGWKETVQEYPKAMGRVFMLNPSLTRAEKDMFCVFREVWDAGTPGKLWDSALVIADLMANRLKQQPRCLDKCHVVDLSAGTGCVGLLIKAMCRSMGNKGPMMTLTDLPEALDLIRSNYRLNQTGLDDQVQIEQLRWGVKADAQRVITKAQVDIVLASDVLYVPQAFESLIATLYHLCTPHRTVVYLAYKRRGLLDCDEARFFNRCSQYFYINLVQDMAQMSPPVYWEQTFGPLLSPAEIWFSRHLTRDNQQGGVQVYRLVKKSSALLVLPPFRST
ncbi:putative methyltransferase-domain-containing protein [Phycomyces nitens]|nr:putative methyltransferase-domain-containing protein [Phycomyces nitens]